MDSTHDKKRTNVEVDRLSGLPDDLIHKILSYIGLQDAIGTSSLSSRWRFIWTSMPYLSFSSENFYTLPKFSKFVTHVLSRRKDHVEVFCVNLRFRGKAGYGSVKKITNYAFSHNVQQMSLTCLLQNHMEFPLSLFTSYSLKNLSLTKENVRGRYVPYSFKTTSTWELPTLTTLHLHGVILCCHDTNDKCTGLFSKCANLKDLSLEDCTMMGPNDFSICHPTLSDLTLKSLKQSVNVVAAHLKNLSVTTSTTDWSTESQYLISAPNLASLVYKGYQPWQLNTDGFPSLVKADIIVLDLSNADAHKTASLACLLQELHNVQYLKLSLEYVEILSSSMELSSYQPSSLTNLKSLMIYPRSLHPWNSLLPFSKKKTIYSEVESYFLDGSPSASFTMEITAKKLMSELWVLLKQEKANITYRPRVVHRKPQPETKAPLQVEGHMTRIKSCWENFGGQIEQRRAKAWDIFSKLQRIEELLTILPPSRKAMIQPCFSSLCAEADFVTSKMTDYLKMQCDENLSRLSVCFHELATRLDRSS